jgi:hypothetical protein
MKKNILKLLSLAIMLVFIAPVMNAQAGKANFSGTWTLNAEKSTFGQGGGGAQGGGQGGQRMGGGNMVAKQEGNVLTIERTRPGRDGGDAVTTTTKYTLDGKESVNTSTRGDSKSVATWSPDGKTLTVVTNRTVDMNGESRTMKTTEEWTLTSATALAVKSTTTSQNGDRTTTMVYDKK